MFTTSFSEKVQAPKPFWLYKDMMRPNVALRLGSKIELELQISLEKLHAIPLKCELLFGLVHVYVEK